MRGREACPQFREVKASEKQILVRNNQLLSIRTGFNQLLRWIRIVGYRWHLRLFLIVSILTDTYW